RFHLRNDRAERVSVIRVAGQRCGMGDKLAASGMLHCGGDAHLDPELVRPVRLALADALDLWRVQGIELAAALAALLLQHVPGEISGRTNASCKPSFPTMCRSMSRMTRPR